ncbi:hypothetical protein BU23DRAFT_43542 [Bimuria novae-zelandiae CBS 107.79]|uniref:RING-type domain-containing protein n=1 Tax=Bimuria novae-zelandiae CBS 107.79 TaxID=1447943 RepID=A0A6A5VMJ5_9PLEO|nr:hypothetical protein BU23DRAFT_43542 [Bimuria novae-zelandiae CBS 107.79]
MEAFFSTKLRPTETCIICSDPFSADHLPVALPCHHIFGHACITKWLRNGSGNNTSCPFCRHEIYEPIAGAAFTDASIWTALCAQSPERIHDFMSTLWRRVAKLFAAQPNGDFSTSDLLEHALIPALSRTARSNGHRGPFDDAHSLVLSTWDSLGRPDSAHGLAIPLVRLVRLMTQTSAILPKWLTTVPRTSTLFWRANASLGTAASSANISWTSLVEASQLENPRFFPFLHLYTVLLSQNIVHSRPTHAGPTEREVEQRCCRKFGSEWGEWPEEAFRQRVVAVYMELRRYQMQEKRLSLRGHDEEKGVVTGLWAMAMWRREGSPAATGVAVRRKTSAGWGSGGE